LNGHRLARIDSGRGVSSSSTLSEQTQEPEAFDDYLTKAEASKRIDALKDERGDQH
jgi:Protein of unknown function (DUF3072)